MFRPRHYAAEGVYMTNAKTLSISIASEIENIIIEGSLKPGDRIPNEQEFMETYHTGNTPWKRHFCMPASWNDSRSSWP